MTNVELEIAIAQARKDHVDPRLSQKGTQEAWKRLKALLAVKARRATKVTA